MAISILEIYVRMLILSMCLCVGLLLEKCGTCSPFGVNCPILFHLARIEKTTTGDVQQSLRQFSDFVMIQYQGRSAGELMLEAQES